MIDDLKEALKDDEKLKKEDNWNDSLLKKTDTEETKADSSDKITDCDQSYIMKRNEYSRGIAQTGILSR